MMSKNNTMGLSLEGNIGAGKSTFLGLINQWLDVQIVYEPHTKWQDVGGFNILDSFYQDPSRWAYTFQTYAFVSRVVEQEKYARHATKAVQVLERSIYSDRYCFAKNCFEMGTMTALEWKLYQEWFSWLEGAYTSRIQGLIYLQTDPTICYSRLKKRARAEEQGVSLEYLTMIHKKHEQWLVDKEEVDTYLQKVPVLVLECNKEFEHDVVEQQKHMQKISDFFGIPFKYNGVKQQNNAICL
ncbi:MAG: deoxynucleoside kinase [Candidatus Babeliales bacterium]